MLEITRKYMTTYFKESKRQDDWEEARPEALRSLDDYYLVLMKDRFRPHSDQFTTETDNLIQIEVSRPTIQLNLTIEDRVITESFMWDAETTNDIDVHLYTHYLLKDLLLQHREVVDRDTFEGKQAVIQPSMKRRAPNSARNYATSLCCGATSITW